MTKLKWGWIAAAICFVLLLSACGSDNTDLPQANEPQPQSKSEEQGEQPKAPLFDYSQQASITFYKHLGVSKDYYRDYIEAHITRKFPNVKVNMIDPADQGNTLSNVVAANTVLDIILTTTDQVFNYTQLDVLEPIDTLIKNNQIDLSVFREDIITALRGQFEHGQMYMLPWTYGTAALFYNKEIFDRFGVEYPKDGMTWDSAELKSMVQRLSRNVDGVQYRGIDVNYGELFTKNQLSLPYLDKQDKAVVQTAGWRNFISTLSSLYQIPGNERPEKASNNGQNEFVRDRTLAMWAGNAVYPTLVDMERKGEGFPWDIVTLPTFKEAPGMTSQYAGAAYAIGSNSQHKDLAMHMIAHLTSAEVQIEGGSLLRYPTLKAKDVQEAFGKGDPLLEQKNMKSIHLLTIAPLAQPNPYDSIARGVMIAKAIEVGRSVKDINTALREAEEEINQKVAAEMAR